jgi:hypothetical protein
MHFNISLDEIRKMKQKTVNTSHMPPIRNKTIKISPPDFIVNDKIANDYINNLNNDYLSLVKQRVHDLEMQEQPEQRTDAWYSARETRITASEAACCLPMTPFVCKEYIKTYNIDNFKFKDTSANKYKTMTQFLLDKAGSFYDRQNGIVKEYMSSDATRWGQKYEEEAIRLYTIITGDHVKEFGLICHPSLDWLGASPDGITDKGVMIEIKCPKSRPITGIPPLHYYIQCQIQLESCNLDMCHYLECEMKEHTLDEWLIDSNINFGLIVEYQVSFTHTLQHPDNTILDGDDCQPFDPRLSKFFYPPKKRMTKQELLDWSIVMSTSVNTDYGWYRMIYYTITTYNINSIHRENEWFNRISCTLKDVHSKLEWLQKDINNYHDFKKELDSNFYEDCLL